MTALSLKREKKCYNHTGSTKEALLVVTRAGARFATQINIKELIVGQCRHRVTSTL